MSAQNELLPLLEALIIKLIEPLRERKKRCGRYVAFVKLHEEREGRGRLGGGALASFDSIILMSLWAGHKKDPFVNTIIGISSIKKPLPDQPPRLGIHIRTCTYGYNRHYSG